MSSKVERIARYREILQKDPLSRVYVPLADLLRQHGETEEALVLLEAGLVRNPEHSSALVVLGNTLLQAGRYDHGVKVLEKVLEISPENFVVLRILVEHFLATDAYGQAVPLLERLADFEPDETEWAKLLSDARDQVVRAEDHAAPSAVSDSSDKSDKTVMPLGEQGMVTMTLVDILVSQGYLDKARAALERMKQDNPTRTDVQQRLDQLKSGDLTPGNLPAEEKKLSAEDEMRRRAGQKEQFGDWIENFKSDRGPSS